jgi:hypothetical protein
VVKKIIAAILAAILAVATSEMMIDSNEIVSLLFK